MLADMKYNKGKNSSNWMLKITKYSQKSFPELHN